MTHVVCRPAVEISPASSTAAASAPLALRYDSAGYRCRNKLIASGGTITPLRCTLLSKSIVLARTCGHISAEMTFPERNFIIAWNQEYLSQLMQMIMGTRLNWPAEYFSRSGLGTTVPSSIKSKGNLPILKVPSGKASAAIHPSSRSTQGLLAFVPYGPLRRRGQFQVSQGIQEFEMALLEASLHFG